MSKALDLAALDRVASAGAPRDTVLVTRRWLAQVHAELHAARNQLALLDFDTFGRIGAALTTDAASPSAA
ncbi:hypothetical protein [Sphingomonas sp. 2378]|uniref:hypothetical protein n=1 Tax=Sphingomonas sp. 2378 TaxID=1219748 RepID=UPI00311B39CE